MKHKLLCLLWGLVVFAIGFIGPFYAGYELLPEGWMTEGKTRFWSFPAFIGFAAVAIVSLIIFVTMLAEASGLNDEVESEEEPEEDESQSQL